MFAFQYLSQNVILTGKSSKHADCQHYLCWDGESWGQDNVHTTELEFKVHCSYTSSDKNVL